MGGCVGGGVREMKSPLPVLMQKYLAICIKKSIYVNAFYCIIMILYMHISSWIYICIYVFCLL